jgi:MFS family permease
MLTLGLLSSVLVDAALSSAFGAAHAWRWMVGLPAIPGVVMAASLVMLPESPRWLVLRGDLDQALDIIHQVLQSRGSKHQQDASNSGSTRLGEPGLNGSGPPHGRVSGTSYCELMVRCWHGYARIV